MIKRSNLKALRLMAFAQVIKNVQKFLTKEEDLENLGLSQVKTEFDMAFAALEDLLSPSRKNEQTDLILQLDGQRDVLLMNFIAHCKLFITHPETAKADAAKRSVIKINAYGNAPQRRAYRDETAIIRNLAEEFEETEAKKDITLIGAKQWLDLLKPINERFDEIHSNRTLEQSQKEVGKSKEARQEMQEKFDNLCRAINAMAFVKGEDKFKALADAINEEVKLALASAK
ncbi:DUF6261 family protein [Capnocytophaga catalasegens]|uniref:Hemagglutinin n=1 Tax=Capnocytophaga catalasegens TaxID=1004260 RepID=A0AAV5AUM1_9FLAO|nr:DUF6261 family protein [Capnocytophaga catalasegens]GIZ16332.1 hypothetical protein RCZ03_23320 [Capnocytophaga catalasegens]GJM49142.1 hypothetical protein RCZ15_01180 [Capnocytophaga catalasegens]GJM53674.1 hypothetical protein RCZ16_19900 [Capnocytophaga catalasegens]